MILPMAKIRVLSQVTQLNISEEDVFRGYVDVECGSHVEVRSNTCCRLAFRSTGTWFNFVHVYGFPRAIDFGPEGGGFVRPLERQRSSAYQLSYRFELRRETLPGVYRWPLCLSVAADWDEVPARAPQAAMRIPPIMPT